ncbi:4-hydroxy-tetrahydrodipicolinate reductase [Paratractidigestivibacter sp.]|uniref:4-hydroxy-tetrahydrodipicolinate reductase n=1 Tax=Paratractidigestivibacter sp. TaxID=2847316 RepID=UPI002ABD8186|nr:4-hydroxy-tetrahydrodipicolinate reductase [Paratractidigestivibacter sp.]
MTNANNVELTSVILVGGGRMGQLIAQKLDADGGFAAEGIYDVTNADELDGRAPVVDLVIDFSNKDALPHVLAYVERTGAALVSGTTGFSDEGLSELRALGEKTRVIHSANYSLGIAALKRAAAQAALALGEWDCEIVETHHNQKADAPSGTAILLLDAVDPDHACEVAYGREGFVGARPARQIGMHSLRGGTEAGTHEVHFFGADEEVCLTHRATSRQIFVNGAVAAAKRLLEREENGFYTFEQLMFE